MPTATPDEPPSCADLFKALADETRLAVLRALIGGPRHVSDINEELALEPSLLSHHLRVLRERGLVVSEREGRAVLYQLAPGVALRRTRDGLDLGCCRLTFD